MIRAEQIPPEVVEAAHRAFYGENPVGFREAISAALNAWPMKSRTGYHSHFIILPLPQEVIPK